MCDSSQEEKLKGGRKGLFLTYFPLPSGMAVPDFQFKPGQYITQEEGQRRSQGRKKKREPGNQAALCSITARRRRRRKGRSRRRWRSQFGSHRRTDKRGAPSCWAGASSSPPPPPPPLPQPPPPRTTRLSAPNLASQIRRKCSVRSLKGRRQRRRPLKSQPRCCSSRINC